MANEIVQFSQVLRGANFRLHVCTDPYHEGMHRSGVQYMASVQYRGHKVSITQDGKTFDVRIDDKPLTIRRDMGANELIAYVEAQTK